MMNYLYYGMMGGGWGLMVFFGWLTYLILLALGILAIIALWKYINKK